MTKTTTTVLLAFSFLFVGGPADLVARNKKERVHVSFRDSLDHAIDISDWLITKKGFFPMPILVTEPSLGGFGLGIAPIFISPHDPIERDGKFYPVMPDVTAVAGLYTLNKTWMAGGGRVGMIPKRRLRYKVGAGYVNMNMSYYHAVPLTGEELRLDFNIRAVPLYIYLGKILKNPRFVTAGYYMFAHSDLSLNNNGGVLPDGISRKELKSNLAKLGGRLEFDTRDNSFTPNKGIKSYLDGGWSNPVVGSDFKFGMFEWAFYWFAPLHPKWINGFRFDVQQVVGTVPFYFKPFIDMRGVPAERYQGRTTVLMELEERWDCYRRWSVLFYGGLGKGFDSFSEFSSADWAYSYGTGFRYLLARKLQLRTGVDLAMGPEGFTYYLVFGSSWARQ